MSWLSIFIVAQIVRAADEADGEVEDEKEDTEDSQPAAVDEKVRFWEILGYL